MQTTRREFLASAATFAAGSVRRPNLLYVFSDQHRACSMPREPFNAAEMPNLERFARQGVTFRNCVSNYPLCTPYRSMLLTGRWPYQTGVVANGMKPRLDELSLGETFRRGDYKTGYIGKWHLSPVYGDGIFIPAGADRLGFEDWHVWANTDAHFDKSFTFDQDSGLKVQPNGYNATLMTNEALNFIERHRAKPWMLVLSWNPPHWNYLDAPPNKKSAIRSIH
jgi:arylsulfatase A-like enzyme